LRAYEDSVYGGLGGRAKFIRWVMDVCPLRLLVDLMANYFQLANPTPTSFLSLSLSLSLSLLLLSAL
jgi:hypothetical protein